jgi:hypothetical protein
MAYKSVRKIHTLAYQIRITYVLQMAYKSVRKIHTLAYQIPYSESLGYRWQSSASSTAP